MIEGNVSLRTWLIMVAKVLCLINSLIESLTSGDTEGGNIGSFKHSELKTLCVWWALRREWDRSDDEVKREW